jgi:hypothetical protein
MKEWAELLQGIGAVLWPVGAMVALLVFKGDIRALAARLRRGKLLGQEIELAASLEQLERGAAAALAELPAGPPSNARIEMEHNPATELVKQAYRSPKAALMMAASLIERELREILAVTGLHQGRFNLAGRQMLRALEEHAMLPRNLSGTIDAFWQVRNKIVHGAAASDDEALQALDSGLSVLNLLRSIPRATYVVHNPGVKVYADELGKVVRPNVKALLLEEISPGGLQKVIRAYPTTRGHFVTGRRVAWEWNPEEGFDESWYRDPDSDEMKYGWTESMEFVGRLLDEGEKPPKASQLTPGTVPAAAERQGS